MTTITRICRVLALTIAGLLAMIGAFSYPAQMLAVVGLAVLFVGPLTAASAHSPERRRGSEVRLGAVVAGMAVAVSLLVAGLVALLGIVSVWVIVVSIVGPGVWAWRRGLSGERIIGLATGWSRPDTTPRTAPSTTVPSPPRPPVDAAGPVSTAELCRTWQKTYWLLHDLPLNSPDRPVVIDARRRLLDELERRDPRGFGRWMQTEPRACSDPGRYLTTYHAPGDP